MPVGGSFCYFLVFPKIAKRCQINVSSVPSTS
nr:MAG TPA: hypothetical protein [Caudoviricetes sp.]